jgi:hypothetical protein
MSKMGHKGRGLNLLYICTRDSSHIRNDACRGPLYLQVHQLTVVGF